MSWTYYLGLMAFFTVMLTVFYALAYSAALGIRDNYRRYAQKSDLQWTGPRGGAPSRPRPPVLRLAAAGLLSAWLVVQFWILP